MWLPGNIWSFACSILLVKQAGLGLVAILVICFGSFSFPLALLPAVATEAVRGKAKDLKKKTKKEDEKVPAPAQAQEMVVRSPFPAAPRTGLQKSRDEVRRM